MNRYMERVLNRAFQAVIILMFLTGCSVPSAVGNEAAGSTPTISPNFMTQPRGGLAQDGLTDSRPVRDGSNLFEGIPLAQIPQPVSPTTQAGTSPKPPVDYKMDYLPIFQDDVNPNWIIQRTPASEVNANSRAEIYGGDFSIAFTPGGDGSMLYLVVKATTSENYSRDEILGVSFWLNGGENGLKTDELAVTVLGSNAIPFWDPADISVKSPYDPVFSETRLYYLGINRSIPPNTWVKVELWLDDRIYDPLYNYVTGIYIKTAGSLTHTIYLDDVQLILLSEEGLSAAASPETDPSLAVDNDLLPVLTVSVDAQRNVHPISPYIYGVSVASDEILRKLRPTLNSWGGNPSTRYNWELGNAWNAGRDYFFKNGNYGINSGSVSDGFMEAAMEFGATVRLAIPTLGWVAKNDDLDTCSFPLENGECSDVPLVTCEYPTIIADPKRANVPSDTESIRAWMEHIFDTQEYDVRFVAMDNEPELWGYTHYDVHPTCPTYQEILDKFIEYATVVRAAAPQVEITGPVTCCWYYYWNSAAGIGDKLLHGNQQFLPWFLENVRKHDLDNDIRTLDVLDIHYYQEGVYNQEVDLETSALRLRSTRSLWDPFYSDESWINEPIYLIPRMLKLIEDNYPGLKLGISEWNWGGDQHMNGALAIADVLGIFGREDLYLASYWTHPPLDSPGFFAFKMYTNYDGLGGRFGNTSVWARSTDDTLVSSFAALDSKTGNLHLMLINKHPDQDLLVQMNLKGFSPGKQAQKYLYSQARLTAIVRSLIEFSGENLELVVPAYSITLLVIEPATGQNK